MNDVDDSQAVGKPAAGRPAAGPPDLDRDAARARVNATLFGDVATVRFGRYHLLTRMGRGASGVVWSAFDEQLNRRVALKIMPPDIAAEAGSAGRARLQREARVLAQLRHENVVTVHDLGDHDGTFFIAMELIAGSHLRTWLLAPRTQTQILDVLCQAAQGVAAAHAQQLVHRDIKPENILIGDNGRVCVADFGLAQAKDPAALSSSASSSSSTEASSLRSQQLTASSTHGSRAGTLAYMAPELWDGAEADARSDQWSLAVTACEALTGTHPFPANTVDELAQKLREKKAPAKLPTGPARAALERALAHNPVERFATVAAFAEALRPRSSNRRVVVVAAALAVAGIVTVALVASPAREDCAASDELQQVWSDLVKADVGRALASAGQGPEATAVVVGGFDRYRTSVGAAGTAICEERQQRRISAEDHERRRICLARSTSAASSLVEKIKAADAATAGRSARAFAILPDPAVCSDPEALQILVPVDAATRATVDDIQREVQEAEQLRVLGKPKDAIVKADAALARAVDVDVPASRASAHLARGQALFAMGEDPRAVYQDAAVLALRAGADDPAAAALQALAFAAVERDNDPARASFLADLGRAVAERLPTHQRPRRLADLSNVDCVIAIRTRQLGRAETACRETARLRAAAVGENHPSVASALQNLGIAYAMQRDPRAADVFRDTLAVLVASFGDKHPVALSLRLELASAQMETDFAKAHTTLLDVRRDLVAAFGEEHRDVATSYEHEARLELARKNAAAALAAARKCVALRTAMEGADSDVVIGSAWILAPAERAAGNLDIARSVTAVAFRKAMAAYAPEDPTGFVEQLNQADQLVRDGKPVEARAIAERVLRVALAEPEPEESLIASARLVLGQALPAMEKARAKELLEQARAYFVRFPLDAIYASEVDAALAQLH